jgi:hypothetical protein
MAISTHQSIFSELAEFIVSQPSLEAIADYRVSDAIQAHLDLLLEKNREANLSAEEQAELEKILLLTDLMNLAKARAKLKLNENN